MSVGLAGITPASGYINSQSSIILGFILGVASYGSVHLMKHKLRIDDALDVSSVHGLTGVIGAIFIGFAAEARLNPSLGDDQNGLVFGGTRQIWVQLVAVAVAAAYAGIVTFILCWILDKTIGMKITHEEEDIGLDIVEHGEYAYHNLYYAGQEPHYQSVNGGHIQDD